MGVFCGDKEKIKKKVLTLVPQKTVMQHPTHNQIPGFVAFELYSFCSKLEWWRTAQVALVLGFYKDHVMNRAIMDCGLNLQDIPAVQCSFVGESLSEYYENIHNLPAVSNIKCLMNYNLLSTYTSTGIITTHLK